MKVDDETSAEPRRIEKGACSIAGSLLAQGTASGTLTLNANILEDSMSQSRTFNPSTFTVLSEKRMEGTVKDDTELRSNKDSYDVKFATDVAMPPAEPAAASVAAQMASTKAYLKLVKAIQTGDKQTILALSPPDRRAVVDTPDFPKISRWYRRCRPRTFTF